MRKLLVITFAVILAIINSMLLSLSIPLVFAIANYLVATISLSPTAIAAIDALAANIMQWTMTSFLIFLTGTLTLLLEYYFKFREEILFGRKGNNKNNY